MLTTSRKVDAQLAPFNGAYVPEATINNQKLKKVTRSGNNNNPAGLF